MQEYQGPSGAEQIPGLSARDAHTSGERTQSNGACRSPSSTTASNGSATTADGMAGNSLSATAEAWLDARGLDIEMAVRMGVMSVLREGAEWLKIPYVREGRTINHKYRRLDGKDFRNDKDAEHDLWNVDVLSDDTLMNAPLVITEGELDALACIQAGFPRTVSIPNGWTAGLENSDGGEKFADFVRNEETIRRAKTIIAAVDGDETGNSLLLAIDNFFDSVKVVSVDWPKGCKDPNDVVREHGAKALRGLFERARQVDPPGGSIVNALTIPQRPERTMWKLHDEALNRIMAFRSCELSAVTGIPGSGKTTFATWIAHHLVKNHDLRIGMCMFETDSRELVKHLVKMRTGTDDEFLSADEQLKARQELSRNFRFVEKRDFTNERAVHGLEWLKMIIRRLAAREGCKLVIVDPWNELDHVPDPRESMTNYINYALTSLRVLADKLDIHLMILAHPRKMADDRAPTGYDVADSAAWMNKPRLGITVHQAVDDDGNEFVQITSWKVSNRYETGCQPGKVKMSFDKNAMVYRTIR